MRRATIVLTTAGAVLAASLAIGQPAPFGGYLGGDKAPDTLKILQPAPKPDDARGVADRAIFRQTRALQGTPRWSLAQNDVNEATPAMLKDFSCSVGVALDPTDAPRTAAIFQKVRADVRAAVDAPKDYYQRQRPYLIDEGPTCVDKTDSLAKSPDYPSGHATWAWTLGLILAELAPDRAAPILYRARAFGESRVVCGVHNASAIEAARTNASSLVAVLHADGAFRSDMDAARAEMAHLRGPGAPAPSGCDVEAATLAKAPW